MPTQRRLAAALDRLDEGLVILGPSGEVEHFNPSAASMLGLGRGADRRELAAALAANGLGGLAAAGSGCRELALPWEGGSRRIRAKAFALGEDGRPEGAALLLADVTETALLVERLEALASTDGLTGALNRRRFDELGARDAELARRSGAPVGVLMLDLDYFKRINDEWGHAAGDEALKVFCARCSGELRATDAFARYGGEEFAALLPGAGAEGALAVAERLRLAVAASPIPWEGRGMPLTVSVGVYAGILAPDEGLESMVRRADEALYAAKARGRNRVAFWSPLEAGTAAR